MHEQPRDYESIPGTYVYDAARGRMGYALEHVLHVAQQGGEPQELQGERSRVSGSALRSAPSSAARCWSATGSECCKVGGNIYYTIKIAFCDGLTFQDVAGMMSGVPKETYAQDDAGGRAQPRGQPLQGRQPRKAGGTEPRMAKIVAGIAVSHVPAIGVAMDKGHDGHSLLGAAVQRLWAGARMARQAWRRMSPSSSTTIMHRAFSLEIIPTFLIGVADKFPIADEGFGPRPGARGARPPRPRLASGGVADPR